MEGEKNHCSSHHPNREVMHAPPSANCLSRRAAAVVGGEEGPEGDHRVKFPLPLPPSTQPAAHCSTRADTHICPPLPAVHLGLTFLCSRHCRPPRVQRHASHQVCRGGRWVGTPLVCCGCREGGAVTRGKRQGGGLVQLPQFCFDLLQTSFPLLLTLPSPGLGTFFWGVCGREHFEGHLQKGHGKWSRSVPRTGGGGVAARFNL